MRKFLAATMMASSVLAVNTALVPMGTADAQEDSRYGGTIRSIIVEGNQRIEARTVQSYLLVEPGDAFDPDRIDLSLANYLVNLSMLGVGGVPKSVEIVIRVLAIGIK